MLGIIIGVAAVVAMTSLGEGTTEEIVGQFEGLGSPHNPPIPEEDPG